MSAATATETPTAVVEETLVEGKEKEAFEIVRKNMAWAMGLSVIPVPLFDFAAVAGFQARSLNELSGLYNVQFSDHLAKNITAALISGLGAVYLGQTIASSAIKFVPIIGPLTSLAATPIMAGALTYATGVVFIQHFESGGTFLTFDSAKVRNHFKELYQEGLKAAADELAGSKSASSSSSDSESSKKSAK